MCLYSLNRLGEAAEAARRTLVEASRQKDVESEVKALALLARSLTMLDRREEAAEAGRAAFKLLDQIESNDRVTRTIAAGTMLLAMDADAPTAIRAYRELLSGAPAPDERGQTFLYAVAQIVTRECAWPQLIRLLEEFPEYAESISRSGRNLNIPGVVITDLLLEGSHSDALKLVRHLVSVLSTASDGQLDSRVKTFIAAVLVSTAELISSRVADADALSEISSILNAHEAVPKRAQALIMASASYHLSGRDQRVLVRLDPDLITLIMTAFPPALRTKDGKSRPKKARKTKR
jgi:tetratricopeptide (TPR) repeat protein